MTCDDIRLLLESDTRDAAESKALRAHLAACCDCADYAAEMRAQDAAFSRALKPANDDVRFARVKMNLSQSLENDFKARARWRRAALAGSVAATVLLCVGAYWMKSTYYKPVAPIALQPANAAADVFTQVAELQTKIRTTQVLDELVQLQAAMDAPEDQDGKSAAEDAELYIERILALHGTDEQAFRETLAGIDQSGVSNRLKKVRDSMTPDAPKPVVASLDLAISMFDQAGKIAQQKGRIVQEKEVAYAE